MFTVRHCVFVGLFAFFATAGAQPPTLCQLLQQRLDARSGDPKLCIALYQYCIAEAAKAPDFRSANNQCSALLGECQMGGALGGESLQQATADYKKKCVKTGDR